MKKKFERVSILPPYVFASINYLKAKERFKGRDIIEKAKIFIAEKNPGEYGKVIGSKENKRFVPFSGPQREAMDAEITAIL